MKICPKCKIPKELDDFTNCRSRYDGKATYCKICMKQRAVLYYRKKSESDLDFRQKHKKRTSKFYEDNKEKISIQRHNYYLINKKEIGKRHSVWRNKNRDRLNRLKSERLKNDPEFRIVSSLRARTRSAIKNLGANKSASTIELIGCSIKDARNHIESKFCFGMSWKNYGDWHIDHIKPCASFDLSNPDEQKVCFHYTNLQPLWATTSIARKYGDYFSIGNIEKGDKVLV